MNRKIFIGVLVAGIALSESASACLPTQWSQPNAEPSGGVYASTARQGPMTVKKGAAGEAEIQTPQGQRAVLKADTIHPNTWWLTGPDGVRKLTVDPVTAEAAKMARTNLHSWRADLAARLNASGAGSLSLCGDPDFIITGFGLIPTGPQPGFPDHLVNPSWWLVAVIDPFWLPFGIPIPTPRPTCIAATNRCLEDVDRKDERGSEMCLNQENFAHVAACLVGSLLWRDNAQDQCYRRHVECTIRE